MASPSDPASADFTHDIERLDQHFLDPSTAEEIVDRAAIHPDDVILDIGAGTGILTAAILDRSPSRVLAVEADRRCLPYLERLRYRHANLVIEAGRLQHIPRPRITTATLVISNPPFSVLEHLTRMLRDLPRLRAALLCVSHRWAESAAADIDSPGYGVTSLAIQSRHTVKIIKPLDGRVFTPPTRRPAALLQLTRRSNPDPGLDLLAGVALDESGLQVKDFVRSHRLRRTLGATRHHALRHDDRVRRMQQRRVRDLTSDQLAALALIISAPSAARPDRAASGRCTPHRRR